MFNGSTEDYLIINFVEQRNAGRTTIVLESPELFDT